MFWSSAIQTASLAAQPAESFHPNIRSSPSIYFVSVVSVLDIETYGSFTEDQNHLQISKLILRVIVSPKELLKLVGGNFPPTLIR